MAEACDILFNKMSVDDDWESFCEKNNDTCKNDMYNNSMSYYDTFGDKNTLSSRIVDKNYIQELSEDENCDMDEKYIGDMLSGCIQSEDMRSGDMRSGDMRSGDMRSGDMRNSFDIQPKCSDIYISTKTQIAYLNQSINLADVFWSIPIIPYYSQSEGLIKKSMKFNTLSQDDLDENIKRTNKYKYVEQNIILQIKNPTGRIQFKDVRKISIGLCKRDILGNREKKNNSAFYNCFVIIVRILQKDIFKEVHVKVFNTGKMEIPGIQSDEMLERVLSVLTLSIRPLIRNSSIPLEYLKEKSEIVLINSNFKCGYYINRAKMYELLKYTYNINCAYDPCSYPGIQCEFYYDTTLSVQTGCQPPHVENNNTKKGKEEKRNSAKILNNIIKVSFMIFRTGSVLIVGKCNEVILNDIYVFLKNILETEYEKIESKEVQINPPIKLDEKKRKGKMIKIYVEKK